ncbi:MAG: class I SAM-dependent methyltransferase [Bacteroidia bacterium]|nr:class I SAM-dependent methyltransferase [Bacteroidia bacterium]
MADNYNSCEPHFRPENIEKVEEQIKKLVPANEDSSLLDLGCGSGFIIHIAKKHFKLIHGVDVTQAMLDKVDLGGDATIELFNHDSGSYPVEEETFDAVTVYSFLHHLYDIEPTLKTAFKALKQGGKFYADLEPNYEFWFEINKLDRNGKHDPIVKREIEMVTYKDEDIEKNFGVDKEVFNNAEYGKNIQGGLKEEILRETLLSIGFKEVNIFYHWFLGQGQLINDEQYSKEERFDHANVMHTILEKALPLSKSLFKYLGFIAVK